METLFDHVGRAGLVLGTLVDQTVEDRLDTVAEYFEARRALQPVKSDVPPYHPLPPAALYLERAEWAAELETHRTRTYAAFNAAPSPAGTPAVMDAGGRPGRDFVDIRVQPGAVVFDAVRDHTQAEHKKGRRVLIAAFSTGSRERLGALLAEHGLGGMMAVSSVADVESLPKGTVGLAVLGIERGYVAPGLSVISEQDILGERLTRPSARRVRPENVLTEASALQPKDFVVHVDHGIGRYEGLVTLQVGGAAHDCLHIAYDGDAKLFVPVENIEMLSRYGSEEAGVQLDRLGGAAWQARKARLKKRIREMADKLIAVAALRQMRSAPVLAPPEGAFDEFCARFQYTETDDQLHAIEDVLADLESGRPMDRLICGDVGFGKTEVALRAAFTAALSGRQVAVVVPTTLLARQHHQTFRARFQGLPVRIETLSRLIAPKAARATKDALATGDVDIVIGTHALLASSIRFKNIGLLIIDEEQHFGVSHKERLKALKADVHVLTLSATPIPRTMHASLVGIRDISTLTQPPPGRQEVETRMAFHDPVLVKQMIHRELARQGQVYYLHNRVSSIERVASEVRQLAPQAKVVVGHGKMTELQMEKALRTFLRGDADILVCTTIIENGLDIPRANTMLIERADRFGLAELHQLRGRVGRSSNRAHCVLLLDRTTPI
ncbi:MAG: DEAD/DEAH box helicase, partial [Acidobacteria bacterium]|nr:DEAD/DEAH box helicase [Acidobacteriota bacterium]